MNLMKVVKGLYRGSEALYRVVYFLVAVVIIVAASYILGGKEFLAGSWGTDFRSALSNAYWIDKYFPNVPFWYPLAGGGVSITHSYPMLAFYIVSILHRLTNFNVTQVFAFLAYSSVPLMATGIYLFVATRIKNQTAALVAAIFYLVSPLAWTWIVDWGFYAEAVSHIFVVPAIIFWDLFFNSYITNPQQRRNVFYLILASLFLSLTLLTHFGAGFGVIGLYGFYILGYFIKERERKKVLVRGVAGLLMVTFLTFGLCASTMLSYNRYTKIAGYGGSGGTRALEQIKEGTLNASQVLKLTKGLIRNTDWLNAKTATRSISFPTVVSLFAILGVLLSFRTSRTLSLSLFAVFSLTATLSPGLIYWSQNHLPSIFINFISWRWSFIPLRMVVPTLAATGIFFTFDLILFWLKGGVGKFIKGIIVCFAGLAVASYALYNFGYLPAPEGKRDNYGAFGIDLRNLWGIRVANVESGTPDLYKDMCESINFFNYIEDKDSIQPLQKDGTVAWCSSIVSKYFLPLGVKSWCEDSLHPENKSSELCNVDNITEAKLKDIWNKCRSDNSYAKFCDFRFKSFWEQLALKNWVWVKPVYQAYIPEPLTDSLDKIVAENPKARIDFSPYVASYGMISPQINLNRQLSQIFIYTSGGSSINQRFDSYLTSALYLKNPIFGDTPDLAKNISEAYGLNYIYYSGSTDTGRLKGAGWEDFIIQKSEEGDVQGGVMKFTTGNSLISLNTKPTVLVIGQNRWFSYDTVFLIAYQGIIPYDDATLIWGGDSVDGYSLQDLKKFDTVLLYDYTYKNRSRANSILKSYVEGGGSLFIETGIQYKSPDWQTQGSESLDVIPYKKLTWQSVDKNGGYQFKDDKFTADLSLQGFGPLVINSNKWGFSTAKLEDAKSWTKPILVINDFPLIAYGNLGKGKIVWSGINGLGHAKQGANFYRDEMQLYKNLFSWLIEGKENLEYKVDYERVNPDRVVFNIEDGTNETTELIWKEAYYPDFSATLISGSKKKLLNIYRTGPGWSLILVPKVEAGDKIVFEYHKNIIENIYLGITVISIGFVLFLLYDSIFLGKKSKFIKVIGAVDRGVNPKFMNVRKNISNWWKKDDEDGTPVSSKSGVHNGERNSSDAENLLHSPVDPGSKISAKRDKKY